MNRPQRACRLCLRSMLRAQMAGPGLSRPAAASAPSFARAASSTSISLSAARARIRASSSPFAALAQVSSRPNRQPPFISIRHFSSTGPRAAAGNAAAPVLTSSATSAVQQDAVVSQAADTWLPFLPYLSETLQQLPSTLGISGPHATAVTIVLVTIVLRSSLTLPAALWQRARSQRMAELVLPEFEAAKKRLPVEIGRKMARKRASMKEYQLELNKEVRRTIGDLFKKYNCNPTKSMLVPLLINIPLFLLLSAVIRHGCVPPTPWSGELAPFPWTGPSADLQAKFAASAKMLAERGLSPDQVAMMAPKQGPSLIERDPTGFGPLAFGMITLLSVELGAWRRQAEGGGAPKDLTTILTEHEKEETKRMGSVQKQEKGKVLKGKALTQVRSVILNTTLRAGAIIFVPIAMQVPSALLVYWLSSVTYTLFQNGFLAMLDSMRAKKKAVKV